VSDIWRRHTLVGCVVKALGCRHHTRVPAPTVSGVDGPRYELRGELEMSELQRLFRLAWDGHGKPQYEEVLRRSFTWVAATAADQLVGFVNVAWDGGVHFFLLDTTVHPDYQRRRIGSTLVRMALDACRGHGEWMHVDSDRELMERLYLPAGFVSTDAGTADLSDGMPA
jgi:ribosomal protein S18 acetylase RimI-like enzyme